MHVYFFIYYYYYFLYSLHFFLLYLFIFILLILLFLFVIVIKKNKKYINNKIELICSLYYVSETLLETFSIKTHWKFHLDWLCWIIQCSIYFDYCMLTSVSSIKKKTKKIKFLKRAKKKKNVTIKIIHLITYNYLVQWLSFFFYWSELHS